jgi:hypothetical protein
LFGTRRFDATNIHAQEFTHFTFTQFARAKSNASAGADFAAMLNDSSFTSRSRCIKVQPQ